MPKKRLRAAAELGESSTSRDPSRFKHQTGQISLVRAENGRIGESGLRRVSGVGRGRGIGRLIGMEELAEQLELAGLEDLEEKETDLLPLTELELMELEQLRLGP